MEPPLPPDPPPRPRRLARGPDRKRIEVLLETVTPLLGGGTVARELDENEPVRAPGIRGQLRFWWRALCGHLYDTTAKLAQAEAEIFGAAGKDGARRSAVDVRVEMVRWSEQDRQPIDLRQVSAYALWPARNPPASRWKPGLRFRLIVNVPVDQEAQLRNALRAFLLFGGYGSRTRRGCGSLKVVEDAARQEWLPDRADLAALCKLFGDTLLAPVPGLRPRELPLLRGARMVCGSKDPAAQGAWESALGWLRDFRQGVGGAREPGKANRPGRSNWPEPDKVRHLGRPRRSREWQHPPRYNRELAWPRAGFGLPINGQFQRKDPNGKFYPNDEPDDFQLLFRDRDGTAHDRLASPLIVKPLPLADGSFVPMALWLFRAYPEGGKVFLKWKEGSAVPGSEAPFDKLLGKGDASRFEPLAKAKSLQEAFFTWLCGTKKHTEMR